MTTWGIVSTIKAPLGAILDFAAHHVALGAHRIYIYLDAPDPPTRAALKAHPKIRVFDCDERHWKRLGMARPAMHQPRQTANASHCHTRPPEVDWLIHMDVDEFLWPEGDPPRPVAETLAALPADCHCARVRPAEQLAGAPDLFKRFIPAGPERDALVARIYPQFGAHVKGGFLSHLAGKLFLRTGLGPVRVKIHNAYLGAVMNPGEVELTELILCHAHAKSWEEWRAAYRYRLEQGSYRAGLAPTRPRDQGGMSLHEVFSLIEAEAGEDGLRAFFDELGAVDPAVRRALDEAGLLLHCPLDLATKRRKHFPDFARD